MTIRKKIICYFGLVILSYLATMLYWYLHLKKIDPGVINLISSFLGQIIIINLIIIILVMVSTGFLIKILLISPLEKLGGKLLDISHGIFDTTLPQSLTSSDELGTLTHIIIKLGDDLHQKNKLEKFTKELNAHATANKTKLENSILKLEKTKIAILNILEDLSISKKEVERKVTERTIELTQERAKLEKIAENMNTGAILVENNGKVIFINNKAHEFIQSDTLHYGEVLKKLATIFDAIPIPTYLKRCLAGENIVVKETTVGSAIYTISFQVLPNTNGLTDCLIWITDITEEKILEHSKSELVATASHQLRTPLTVTKGNTEMLLDESFGTLNDEQKAIIKQTADSNENMILLVNQMLDITKIEQGKLAFELQPLSPHLILEKAIHDLTHYADERKVILQYEHDKNDTPLILGEKSRLYQVFQNLIENAVKYGISKDKKNQAVVNISFLSNNKTLTITVTDHGLGIPNAEQEKIFQRFYRASNAIKSVIDGTGLGLHIVKSIIEHLHGTITFVSKENEGTTFMVTFSVLPKDTKGIE